MEIILLEKPRILEYITGIQSNYGISVRIPQGYFPPASAPDVNLDLHPSVAAIAGRVFS